MTDPTASGRGRGRRGSTAVTPVTAAALLAVVGAVGCGGGEAEAGAGEWTVEIGTAGATTRVVNVPPEGGAVPTLVGREEVRVGTVEGGGPASFGLVRAIAVLPDGRFAVADGLAEEVRIFGRDGRHLRTFGGEGAGPGELHGMQGVHVDHEGLLRVAEQGNARLSVFDPDRGFVTSYPVRLFSYSSRGPWPAAVDSAGRTVVASSGRYGENRYWEMLRFYDPEMKQLDSVPYHDYTDDDDEDLPGVWRIDIPRGYTFALVPFYSRSQRTLTPEGEFWSSADGTSGLEVARWTPRGDTSLVLVSRRPPEPVTAAERDSAMARAREDLAARVTDPPRLDATDVPETKPPLHGLSLDDRGRLWVRLTEPTADSTVYDVFGRDGAHAETVRLPFAVDPWVPPVVRGQEVWAVTTDALEVQSVVRARLHRAPAGSPPHPSAFDLDVPVVGLVLENDTGCEVDARCALRLRFADTVVTATYGFGEREGPPCPVPLAVSDAAFPLRPGQAVEVTVSDCPGEGPWLRQLREVEASGS